MCLVDRVMYFMLGKKRPTLRKEPHAELMVRHDGTDGAHPYRVWWVSGA